MIAMIRTSTIRADTAIRLIHARMGSLRTLRLADIPAALLPVRQNILPVPPKPAPMEITLHPAALTIMQALLQLTVARPVMPVPPVTIKTIIRLRQAILQQA
ncbi:MAG: hypothetical protein BHW58_00755 [Azospirillum sp. 51_20]|jgi:hypothetical protein|nr:MAG: hypothetical protein BHW58_00755 [Azospirillum sp. 51_20]